MLAHYNIREWSQMKLRRMGSEAILDRTFFINISDRKPQAGRNQTYRESRERTTKYMQMHDSTGSAHNNVVYIPLNCVE